MFINGPISVMRLENKKKVLYIFNDYHAVHSECEEIESIDIHKYILEICKQTNKNNIMYDLFIEDDIIDYERYFKRKDNYILEMRKTAHKISKSELCKNMKIHNTDIRFILGDVYDYDLYYCKLNSIISKMLCIQRLSLDTLENLNIELKNINDLYSLILVNLTNNLKRQNHSNDAEINKEIIVNNIFYKLRFSYENNIIKTKMTNLLKSEMILRIKNLLQDIININSDLDKYKKEFDFSVDLMFNINEYKKEMTIISDVHSKVYNIYTETINIYVILVDLYFLRRFLDKTYITNGLLYCGSRHGGNVAYYLVKYFGYNITHSTYSNPKQLMEEILKSKNNSYNLYLKMRPKYLYQCSNMNGFPKYLM
jgi:hypothetical protein